MHLQRPWWSGLVAAVLGGLVSVTAVGAAGAQFLPVLSTREGAQRSLQIPLANGFIDYLTLLGVDKEQHKNSDWSSNLLIE